MGQLFDRTIQVYRRNFKLFAAISIVLAIPDAVIQLFGVSLATGVLRFISAPFILAAFSLAASHVVFHGPIGPVAILLRTLKRYPMFATNLSGYLAAALAMSSTPLGTWLIVAVGGSAAGVMAAESLNPWQTLQRRDQLFKGDTARALLGSAAILILSVVPIFVLVFPASIVVHLIPASETELSMLTGGLLMTLISCLATPLVPIGYCLLYVHLRTRKEDLDLDDLAKRAASAA